MYHQRKFGSIGLILISILVTANSDAQVVATTASPVLQTNKEVPLEVDLVTQLHALQKQSKELQDKVKKLEDVDHQNEAAKLKLPSVTINGVFQADGVAFNQDDESRNAYGRVEVGGDFRRARLGAKGAVTDRMDYFMQMDFAFFGRPTFTDLWVDFKDARQFGTVRVGQWKQPFSLETVSSFRYTTFMERAGIFQAFTPFRHLGIGFFNNSEDLNWTWAASYFRKALCHESGPRTHSDSVPKLCVKLVPLNNPVSTKKGVPLATSGAG